MCSFLSDVWLKNSFWNPSQSLPFRKWSFPDVHHSAPSLQRCPVSPARDAGSYFALVIFLQESTSPWSSWIKPPGLERRENRHSAASCRVHQLHRNKLRRAPCCIVFGAGRRQRHSFWTNAGWDFLSCLHIVPSRLLAPKHIRHRPESHRDPALSGTQAEFIHELWPKNKHGDCLKLHVNETVNVCVHAGGLSWDERDSTGTGSSGWGSVWKSQNLPHPLILTRYNYGCQRIHLSNQINHRVSGD